MNRRFDVMMLPGKSHRYRRHELLLLLSVSFIAAWGVVTLQQQTLILSQRNLEMCGPFAAPVVSLEQALVVNDGISVGVNSLPTPTAATEPTRTTPVHVYEGPSRVFQRFEHPFPCYPGERKLMVTTPSREGILFQRPTKVGSTTMVGIVLRLAHNRAEQWNREHNADGAIDDGMREKDVTNRDSSTAFGATKQLTTSEPQPSATPAPIPFCKHRAMHASALRMEYGQRDRTRSFLLSLVRDPKERAASMFFHFQVSAYKVEPTDANFVEYTRRMMAEEPYVFELPTRRYRPSHLSPQMDDKLFLAEFAAKNGYNTTEDLDKVLKSRRSEDKIVLRRFRQQRLYRDTPSDTFIQHILDDYDFIAVMERLDESLVVLQMLLGLSTKDILYTKARSSGSFSNGSDRPCIYINKPFLTEGMERYFASDEWRSLSEDDWKIYRAVNASLDRTIEWLGRDEFDRNLHALQTALASVQEHCRGRIRPMCDGSGTPIEPERRTCYIWAEGCDHECLNDLEMQNVRAL